jgi:hypothetical protein
LLVRRDPTPLTKALHRAQKSHRCDNPAPVPLSIPAAEPFGAGAAPTMTLPLAVLVTALLFGGVTLYAFGFAAALFTTLPAAQAGATLRRVFPWFYVLVIVGAVVAMALWWPNDPLAAAVMGAVALSTWPTRQWLMPAINRATDAGDRRRFQALHGLSVAVTLAHIVAFGWLLWRVV